ncbi:MAG TPA: hypothetical protein DCP63_08140 [Bacteroidetes bacterium]|nr:hypothetical protein [Bacteroidota bacterium]
MRVEGAEAVKGMKHAAIVFAAIVLCWGLGCERLVVDDSNLTLSIGSAEVLRAPVPISPKNGRVISSSEQVTLRWLGVPTVRRYAVQVSEDSVFSTIAFVATVDTTFARTPGLPERAYFWRVRTVNAFEAGGAWSEVWFFIRRSFV